MYVYLVSTQSPRLALDSLARGLKGSKCVLGSLICSFTCACVRKSEFMLTFVPNQRYNRLNVRLLVGFLNHAEPVLQILKALVAGDVIHQKNPL